MFKFNKFRLNKSNTNKKRNAKSPSTILNNKNEPNNNIDMNNNNLIKSLEKECTISDITNSTTMNRGQQGPFSPLSPFSPFSPKLKQSETSETAVLCALKSQTSINAITTKTTKQQSSSNINNNKSPRRINPKSPIISLIQVTDIGTVTENTPIAVDHELPSITSITIRPSTKSSHMIPSNYSSEAKQEDNITDHLYNEDEDDDNDYTSFSVSYDESHSLPSPSSEDAKSLSDIPITELITRLTEIEEENELLNHGYKFIEKITDTLQGELILAEKQQDCDKDRNKNKDKKNVKKNKSKLQRASCIRCNIDKNNKNEYKNNKKEEKKEYGVNAPKEIERVAIKKIDKTLYKQRIAEYDGMTYCVEENIVKEALILHHLTIDNKSTANYVIRFIEFFESDDHFYLVMEYIDGKTNLKDFVFKAHQYIRDGKLKLKEYLKIIKYLFWQLSAVLYWLHNDMHCCHLDLNLENVMLQDADFVIDDKTGSVTINSAISAKLGDFGRGELFKTNSDENINGQEFSCQKNAASLDFIQYLSPQLYAEQEYDARLADTWALGIMLYHCCIGQPLYLMIDDSSCDDDDDESIISMSDSNSNSNNNIGSGYWAIKNGQLKKYLQMNNLTKYVNSKILDLINNLLKFKESERYQISNVLKHSWFKSYFATYKKRIENKSESQKLRLMEQKEKLDMFPYYNKTKRNLSSKFF